MKKKVYAVLYTVLSKTLMIFALITITACATTAQQTPEDRQLERQVERAISTGPAYSSAGIVVTVQNGITILKGSVVTGIEKVLIEKLVKDVEGVTEVRNYIFVD